MSPNPTNPDAVDLIICTRDRADDLRATLTNLQNPAVTAGRDARLTVIDNGSTDHTRQVVEDQPWPHLKPNYHYDSRGGLAAARNAGLAVTDRPWVVYIDDDVSPCDGWLAAMTAPLIDGTFDAVVGTVRPAEHLRRDWMGRAVASALALNEHEAQGPHPPNPPNLIGANMAFGRHVLQHVNGFDPVLDPGGLGYGGDTLFSMQLTAAGLRVGRALDAIVDHHFHADRLLRRSLMSSLPKFARSRRYINHRYGLWHDNRVAWKTVAVLCKLGAFYLRHPLACRQAEGCTDREFKLRGRLAYYLASTRGAPAPQAAKPPAPTS
ncbi:MAG: glycosyltransferase family 2 protein [Planctomycetota bacterium]